MRTWERVLPADGEADDDCVAGAIGCGDAGFVGAGDGAVAGATVALAGGVGVGEAGTAGLAGIGAAVLSPAAWAVVTDSFAAERSLVRRASGCRRCVPELRQPTQTAISTRPQSQ